MFNTYSKIWNKQIAELCNTIQKKFIRKLDETYRAAINNNYAITNVNNNYAVNPYVSRTLFVFYISTMAYIFYKR